MTMQLEGATEFERRVYDTCLRVENGLPASKFATDIVVALSEAGEELQRLRLLLENYPTKRETLSDLHEQWRLHEEYHGSRNIPPTCADVGADKHNDEYATRQSGDNSWWK